MEDNKFGWSFSLKFINVWSWKRGRSRRTLSHWATDGQELGTCQAAAMPGCVGALWWCEESVSIKPFFKRQNLKITPLLNIS